MGGCCSKDTAVHADSSNAHHRRISDVSCGRVSLVGTVANKTTLETAEQQPRDREDSATPSSVKVAVIVRPLLPFEQQKGGSSSIVVYPPDKVALPPLAAKTVASGGDGAGEFCFDRVYHATHAHVGQQMYKDMVQPVVERFCQGYNACILAYGQTGSGKTYTMGGPSSLQQHTNSSSSSSNSAAVVPQACAQLLEYVAGAKAVYDVQLKMSYVEIYNEVIQDLLAPSSSPALPASGSTGNFVAARAVYGGGGSSNGSSSSSSGGGNSPRRTAVSEFAFGSPMPSSPLRGALDPEGSSSGVGGGGSISIYENSAGQIVLDGVTEMVLSSAADLAALLQKGSALRATAAHRLNQQSSRSHAILTLTLQQRAHASTARTLPPEVRCLFSKMHFVDLAGSERAKETGTTGQRFAEGVSINRGLLELGNVINALTEGASRKHIPYRNSKLTRLLQDSLGGNSETLFIACVSPADTNRDHTLSTLRYASRAMTIKNSLQRSVMGPAEELAYLRELVSQLQAENTRLKEVIAEAGLNSPQGKAAQARTDTPVCELFVHAC